MYSGLDTFHDALKSEPVLPGANFKVSKVGFPIRISTDQRLFAPSRSFSQRTTSFIASYRQGIHQMPLGHLIALISNAHPVLTPLMHLEKDTYETSTLGLGQHCRKTRISSRYTRHHSHLRGPSPSTSNASRHTMLSGDTANRVSRHISSSRCQENRVAIRPAETVALFKHGCGSAKGRAGNGGARRDRTDDLMLAKHALSQLSYGPFKRSARFGLRLDPLATTKRNGGPGKI